MDNKTFDLIEKYRLLSATPSHQESRKPFHSDQVFHNRITLSITETAVWLGLSPKSVERMIKRGEIRAKRVGRRLLIAKSEIEAWLQQKE